MTDAEADAERTLRVVRISAGLGTLGLAFESLLEAPAGTPGTQVVAMAICAVIWGWSLVRRHPPTLAAISAVFLVLMAVVITGLYAITQRIAESGINWVPFRADQLGALAIALVAPPVAWVGVVAILAMMGPP